MIKTIKCEVENHLMMLMKDLLILLSYLETICNFKFDGTNFDIKYNGKEVLNGNPKNPSIYKITYNDNKEVINVSLVK